MEHNVDVCHILRLLQSIWRERNKVPLSSHKPETHTSECHHPQMVGEFPPLSSSKYSLLERSLPFFPTVFLKKIVSMDPLWLNVWPRNSIVLFSINFYKFRSSYTSFETPTLVFISMRRVHHPFSLSTTSLLPAGLAPFFPKSRFYFLKERFCKSIGNFKMHVIICEQISFIIAESFITSVTLVLLMTYIYYLLKSYYLNSKIASVVLNYPVSLLIFSPHAL